jgi:hypothetical protein
MPTAYTPGLRISEATVIRRERRLPVKGEVLVEKGAAVTPETVVARALLEGNLYAFKAAEQLGVSPAELIGMLKKQVGETVAKDELLAESKGMFGLFRNELRSPVAGGIEHISAASGYIGLRQPPRPIEVQAYLQGTVTEILPAEGVIVESCAALVQGIFGVGGERYGVLRMAAAGPEVTLTEQGLSEGMRGAILVGGAGVNRAALQKAAQIGVAGMVVGSLPDDILQAYVGYDIGVAVTGQEKVPFPLIITEGFGEIAMTAGTFRLLQSLQGRVASINGATQIRAGVIRPEIIVPGEDRAALLKAQCRRGEEFGQLAPGVKVRLIREPRFGLLGEVAELPSGLQEIETGSALRVARVKLENGETVTVPRPNLEIIQE